MALVIITLEAGARTHLQTHTHTNDPHRINFKKLSACQHAPSLKVNLYHVGLDVPLQVKISFIHYSYIR